MVMLTSFPPPTEGIKHTQPAINAFINARDLGSGTLYIAESRVSWVSNTTGQGFSLEYPHITLHAVSKDKSSFPHECLYLMLDSQLEEPEPANGEESDDESETNMTEVRFAPEDQGVLDAMFEAMSFCQTLHPDPDDSFSDDGGFDDDENEGEYDVEGGDKDQDGNRDEPMETGQFEDADPDH